MPAATSSHGRRRALLIATGDYRDKQLTKLRAPSSDVEAIAEVLGDEQIGEFEVEPPVVDQTKRRIETAIGDFFVASARDDFLLLYLSGHGLLEMDQLFFAARDTQIRTGRMPATAVSSTFVNDALANSRATKKLLVLDCCHSGAIVKGYVAKGSQDVGVEHRLASAGGVVVLTASSATESAYEKDVIHDVGPKASSVFTDALVQGLKTGEADQNRDGLISIDELYDYIVAKVVPRRQVSEPGASPQTVQTPGFYGESRGGTLVIAHEREAAALGGDVLAACRNDIPGVRQVIVATLAGLLADPRTAEAAERQLRTLASDAVEAVASAALAALDRPMPRARARGARRADTAALDLDDIREAADSALPEIRKASIDALATVRMSQSPAGTASADDALRQLATDPQPDVAHAAQNALSRSGSKRKDTKAGDSKLEATLHGAMMEEKGSKLFASWELTVSNVGNGSLRQITAHVVNGPTIGDPFELPPQGERKLVWREPAPPATTIATTSVTIKANDATGATVTRRRQATASPLPFAGTLAATLMRFRPRQTSPSRQLVASRRLTESGQPKRYDSPVLGILLVNNSNHKLREITVARTGLPVGYTQGPFFEVKELSPEARHTDVLVSSKAPMPRPVFDLDLDLIGLRGEPGFLSSVLRPGGPKSSSGVRRLPAGIAGDPFPVGATIVVTATNEHGHRVRTTTTVSAGNLPPASKEEKVAPISEMAPPGSSQWPGGSAFGTQTPWEELTGARLQSTLSSKPARSLDVPAPAKATSKAPSREMASTRLPSDVGQDAPVTDAPVTAGQADTGKSKGRFRRFLGGVAEFAEVALDVNAATNAPAVALEAPQSRARHGDYEFALNFPWLTVEGKQAERYRVDDIKTGVYYCLSSQGKATPLALMRSSPTTWEVGVAAYPLRTLALRSPVT